MLEETIAKCPRCVKELLDDSDQNFCQHCGFPVDKYRCFQCAAEIDEAFKHCPCCGIKKKL
jgi:ribosomal protein L37E